MEENKMDYVTRDIVVEITLYAQHFSKITDEEVKKVIDTDWEKADELIKHLNKDVPEKHKELFKQASKERYIIMHSIIG